MTRQRSMLTNVRSAISGNSVYALGQFGMLSVLAQLTSPAEVGRYALALAITAPVFLFSSLKLRQVQVTDARGEYSFGEYLGQRLFTSTLASAAVIGVVLALDVESRTAATVAAVTAFKALESIIDIFYGAMQRREMLHIVARSQAWRGAGGFAAFAGAIALTRQVEVAVAALALFTFLQVFGTFIRVRRLGIRVVPSFSRKPFWRLTWLALPLGVGLSVSSLSTNVPRYFIEASEGTTSLGIFAALAYMLMVTSIVINSVGEAASPRLANLYASGAYAQFRSSLKKLVFFGASIGLVGVVGVALVGRPVLAFVFGVEYAERSDVLIVMMAGSAVLYTTMFLGTAVNAMRKFAVQLPINIAILVTTAAVSWAAVPAWGIMGGAIAVAAGEVVALVLYVCLLFVVILPATSRRARRRALNVEPVQPTLDGR